MSECHMWSFHFDVWRYLEAGRLLWQGYGEWGLGPGGKATRRLPSRHECGDRSAAELRDADDLVAHADHGLRNQSARRGTTRSTRAARAAAANAATAAAASSSAPTVSKTVGSLGSTPNSIERRAPVDVTAATEPTAAPTSTARKAPATTICTTAVRRAPKVNRMPISGVRRFTSCATLPYTPMVPSNTDTMAASISKRPTKASFARADPTIASIVSTPPMLILGSTRMADSLTD